MLRPPPIPRPRLHAGHIMTLIVGVRCGESAVLCADSQETYGTLKREVNKLPVSRALGSNVDVVVGGAGHGPLSDVLRPRLESTLARSALKGEESVLRELEAALVAFHQDPVFTAFPAPLDDKFVAGLVCVRSVRARQVWLFEYFNSAIKPVTTYSLSGEDHAQFAHVAQRLYRPGISIQQAVLLGLEVIALAKKTSVYVGGDTRVVTVRPDDMRVEDGTRVSWTEAHIDTQNKLIDELKFNLASTEDQVQKELQAFSNSITAVRGIYGSKFPPWPTPSPSLGDFEDDDSE